MGGKHTRVTHLTVFISNGVYAKQCAPAPSRKLDITPAWMGIWLESQHTTAAGLERSQDQQRNDDPARRSCTTESILIYHRTQY